MALIADSSGVIQGKFTIPAGVPSGNKAVVFNGGGGQRGQATFSGQGTLEHRTQQQQTTINLIDWTSPPPASTGAATPGLDPLAQTFTLPANTPVSGIDLYFTKRPTTPTSVQIRETIAGLPGSRVLAERVFSPSTVNLGDAATRILFDCPVNLLGNVEYAFIVLCGDAEGELAVAAIGSFDPAAQKWITDQPYSIGVLLSSSNASTWTPHQDRDLKFSLLRADYSANSRTINLGQISVNAATDLMLMSYAERPDSATDVQYRLTLPDASVITLSDGMPVQLAAAVTGNIAVQAVLTGNGSQSPLLHPGSQLVAGQVAVTADYVTRAIPAGSNVSIKAIFEASIPSGANVTVQFKGPDAGDAWTAIPQTATRVVDDGFVEFTNSVAGVNEQTVQIRLVLTGNTAARPRVRDLRTFVM